MLHNYMEDLVETVLTELLKKPEYLSFCRCERCMDDVRAYALNHLPPFYGTGVKGEVYGKYSVIDVQKRMDLYKVIVEAMGIVSHNRHA